MGGWKMCKSGGSTWGGGIYWVNGKGIGEGEADDGRWRVLLEYDCW